MGFESNEKSTETITAAALKIGDRVFTGENHTHAMNEADDELGKNWMDNYSSKEISDGFVTDTGRFVERDEAFRIAKQSGQITSLHQDDALDSNQLKLKP